MINIINYDKILGFVYTEKSNKQISDSSKYTFWISKQCSKKEVMSIIKKTYGVNVVKVNIINKNKDVKNIIVDLNTFIIMIIQNKFENINNNFSELFNINSKSYLKIYDSIINRISCVKIFVSIDNN